MYKTHMNICWWNCAGIDSLLLFHRHLLIFSLKDLWRILFKVEGGREHHTVILENEAKCQSHSWSLYVNGSVWRKSFKIRKRPVCGDPSLRRQRQLHLCEFEGNLIVHIGVLRCQGLHGETAALNDIEHQDPSLCSPYAMVGTLSEWALEKVLADERLEHRQDQAECF